MELSKCECIMLVLSYLFYRSAWAMLPMVLPGYWFLRKEIHAGITRTREELKIQFKECILAVTGSLKGGRSVENAFLECTEDMRRLFGKKALIVRELEVIRSGLLLHIPLEEMLADLGKRSCDEDITQFAEIFEIARKSGGNISAIMQDTAKQIGSRIDARLEAGAILGGRQLEQMIMRLMPLGILLYIECTTPGYFDSLYHNFQGVLIMTGCLAVYLAAYGIGEHIMTGIKEG